MFKRLVAFGAVAAIAFPAFAARRTTVEQLQQTLAAATAAHRTDEAVAQQLADVELTARLSAPALQQMISANPGPKTQQMLRAIADASVFIDPPPGEIPTRPAPDVAAQKFMLTQTIHYVARTLHTLPDFLATRQTEHYEDFTGTGLTFRMHAQSPVAFRDGRETDDPSLAAGADAGQKKANLAKVSTAKDAKRRQAAAPNLGLTSWGEFGPILEIVLVDAAKGKLGWSHWEQWDGKPVAVFQFAVDRANSHYSVEFKGHTMGETIDASYGSGNRHSASSGQVKEGGAELARGAVGYHGLLTVDPDTGTILRITIEADLLAGGPISKADIMVEYGPVQIGPELRICPTRSVSISSSQSLYQATPISPLVHVVEQQLNDVKFADYRHFGSEAKLIMSSADAPPDRPETPKENASATAPPVSGADTAPEAAAATVEAGGSSAKEPAAATTAAMTPPSTSPSAETTAVASAPTSSPATGESDEEILVRDVNEMPGMNAESDESVATGSASITKAEKPATDNFTLKVTTRLVSMSLIATDKHGKPITDLKPEDIEIYDNGQKQQLHAFHHSVPGAPSIVSAPAEPSDTFTNAVSAAQKDDAPDTLILLIDESHVAFRDLTRARGEVLSFLNNARPGSRVAVYSMNEHGFHAIQDVTSDHAVIEATLAKWMPSAAAVSQAESLDRRNNQQFDTVRNPSDLNSVNGNDIETPDYITSVDPQLRQMGDNPLRQALLSMVSLARHFASVPGHKSMVWIAGDSVLADWDDKAVGMEKEKSHFEAAILHTKEALNEAHISLYAIDASAVQTGSVSAELENQNVLLNPVATANSAPGGGSNRNTSAGRVTATMQQEMHAIQAPVRELAESTGGRAVNKGGDLKAVLDSIDEESTSLYEIGFDPDTPADGKYHTLQVKVPSRKGVKLRYRSGYLYNEETGSTKDRFQEAVWNPTDLTGIALTAEAEPPTDSASGQSTVKLRIALPGLALEQKNGRWADNLYIFVAQRDDAAQKAEVSGDTLRLSLKPATYDTGMPAGIPYRHPVDMKSKLGSVRVIVVDGNSGKMGSVTMPSSALQP
jgi:VWFA-related protein